MHRIIDLTLSLEAGMRGVMFEPARTFAEHGWNATTLHLYSHCGTHMDAPTHFAVSDRTIDRIPPARFMGPAWVVDFQGIAPRALMKPQHLGDVAARLQPGDGLLLRTGWSVCAHEPKYRDELPRVSVELARWCAQHTVGILGVEQPSVADVHNRDELTEVHQILLGGDVIIVEGLSNLESLRQEKVLFMALPLKLAGVDGSPARALAIEGPLPDAWASGFAS